MSTMGRFIAGALVSGSAMLAACGSSSPSGLGTSVGCTTQGDVASATTASYMMVVDLGPLAQMFSPSEVPSSVPANSEIMLGGSMMMVDGASAEHLEVHICQRASKDVIVGAVPAITFMDATAGTTTPVSVATMEGVGQGQADLHYGNNVAAPLGHSFVVTVSLRGEQAVMRFTRTT